MKLWFDVKFMDTLIILGASNEMDTSIEFLPNLKPKMEGKKENMVNEKIYFIN